jgi:uncharacterized protein (DUF2132 family)
MSQDPLHGITLERIIVELHAKFGWPELAERIRINCFYENPSVKSSLKFLRKTPWARKKVEDLYIYTIARKANKTKKTVQINTASNQNFPSQLMETDPNSTTE